ncbi:DNA-formamidopyrimidine glycosylase [Metamycoplasma canadense]|uniref:Foramidopyrimidine-DNA glycosylase n=1 Tax=Metamycoplasma canadense TaxID=29554 RepID=A0A077L8Z5_9BACT|nr:DNA-formamidopyrimidine glycosylase [Metamycoplasma canadense]BAP39468.1 foramidopyrimidine-DNA glycosylase [Metamycoplasma canadense]
MPELPEVKNVVKNLNSSVLNKKIKDIEILKTKLFKEIPVEEFKKNLIGATITDIFNKGKHIIFVFDNDSVLLSHLRMEGKYRFYLSEFENHKHLMTKFIFDDNSELHYLDSRMFGTFYLRNKNNFNYLLPLSKIASEPKNINIELLHQKLRNSPTAIKTKLLDQSLVAGLGNIYVDEALFASKIHPLSKSKNLSIKQLSEIMFHSQRIMDKSFELGGSTIHTYESFNNQIGSFQDFLLIHNDRIKTCTICKNKTVKIKVNGRGTYLCNNCQEVY